MIDIVIASTDADQFTDFCSALSAKPDHDVKIVTSDPEILDAVAWPSTRLLVIDTRLARDNADELIRNVLMNNAMINIAVMSDMSAEDFHEAMVGFGVLMQLPLSLGHETAEELWRRYRVVNGIIADTSG